MTTPDETHQLRTELSQLQAKFQKLERFTLGLEKIVREVVSRQNDLGEACLTVNEVTAGTSELVGEMHRRLESVETRP